MQLHNRNSNLGKRDCLVKYKDMIVTNGIKPLYRHKNVTDPHCVTELLMTDWKRMAQFY